MIKKFFKTYVVDALSHMAYGLFCSLILGLIIGQIAKIPGLAFLSFISEALSSTSPLVGACIGLAIANGFQCSPLVVISSAVTGALGYQFGGQVGAGILQLFERGNVSKYRYKEQRKNDHQERKGEQNPKNTGDFIS